MSNYQTNPINGLNLSDLVVQQKFTDNWFHRNSQMSASFNEKLETINVTSNKSKITFAYGH